MKMKEQLLLEHSKANSSLIRDFVGTDVRRFENLLELFESDEYRIAQRAAMVISACLDKNPKLFEAYKERMLRHLFLSDQNVPVKRNTLRIFQFMSIPLSLQSQLFDYCLGKLYLTDEPIAVKAFAMQVACNIVKDYPELRPELEEAIYLNLENNKAPGILSRGKTVLKQLAKL
jgi:hypothetical protein